MTVGNIIDGYFVPKFVDVGGGKGKFMAQESIEGISVGNADDVTEGSSIGKFILQYRRNFLSVIQNLKYRRE